MTPEIHQENNHPTDQQVISVGEWVLYLFLFAIPLVNIILPLIWVFGNEPNPTKRNYGKAYLIWLLIGIVVSAIMIVLFYSIFSGIIYEVQQQSTVNMQNV